MWVPSWRWLDSPREVDEAKIDDELGDLHDSDVLLPPYLDTSRSLEVIPVHDHMNHEVEGDWNPRDGCVAKQLGVAEESSRAMVVGMEKCQGLLLEEKEDGVDQLQVLGQVVELL